MEEREAVVVRVAGATCARCNRHHRDAEHTAHRSRVTLMVTRPDGERPRVESLRENVRDKSASYLEPRVIAAPRETVESPDRFDATWRAAVQESFSEVLDAEDEGILRETMGPEQCEVLDALAAALDEVWRTVAPESEETEVVLRIVGIEPALGALVAIVVERVVSRGREPGALIGETLRFTGIAICTTTENTMLCRCVRVETELTPGGAPEVMRQVQARFAEITAVSTDMTIGDLLETPGRHPERVGVARTEPGPEHVEDADAGTERGTGGGTGGGGGGGGGGGRRVGAVTASLDVVGGSLDGPSSTATFGTP
ncbi:hypothetical protein [Krasilnikovia sp. MM14-A1004]|uniref:hypothetical protein n=1 Tax=Krasilnikovia sp. MM14-A1004 TaxID=3373541 RepID=UPI00399D3C69